MTSARKVRTNRANARASTGPKTSAGRARSARNALRHGLNVPIADLEVFSPEVERLAEAIRGTQPGDAPLERPLRLVAEAQIDMHRVRQARYRFLADKLGQRDDEKLSTVRPKKELLRRNLQGRMGSVPHFQGLIDRVSQFPEGAEKFALILQQESRQLALFDRYENRARRRRDRAIRSLDEARLLKTKSR
jgi:hypothetical protein